MDYDALMQRHNDLCRRLRNKGLTEQRQRELRAELAKNVKDIGRLHPELVATWDCNGDAVTLEIDLQA